MEGIHMATWSVCTRFGAVPEQKVMINLDNVLTIERADDRTIVNMMEGMREVLATDPGDVIKPYQVSGHAPLI
jgi:hypothetical protein